MGHPDSLPSFHHRNCAQHDESKNKQENILKMDILNPGISTMLPVDTIKNGEINISIDNETFSDDIMEIEARSLVKSCLDDEREFLRASAFLGDASSSSTSLFLR